ncbi:CaiB/BaiF CoA-transferase family protein [Microbulbifer sp. THAF38]|uniref:CaiB/BaiF CoA transferase family protein n=1 Tax=Microbulbifer sp. THAF38 TaxID=2587856 RepID=UPI001269677E|nr:CoA transferase [Microbulbifer sp. THAF38]QFT55173.1 Succinyl-CoA:(R)-benzylsuccinate CoA-transferase subunit BbsF [Microbulbifer sp. THAF38]
MNEEDFFSGANPGPLNGMLVVSLEQILAGPYCTKLLWELGATIVKVEQPEGDIARSMPPFFHGNSVYFSHVNYGKKSIALNLEDEADKDIFKRLIQRADVFFENMPVGYLEKIGFKAKSLLELNPKLVCASLSGFGQNIENNTIAYDVVIQAMSSLMSVTGYPDAGPVRVGAEIGDVTGATYMAIAIVSSLYERVKNQSPGICIDVSLLDSLAAIMEGTLLNYSANGEIPKPKGNKEPATSPFDLYQCQDRKVGIVCGNQSLYEKFCSALGCEYLLKDPRFVDNQARVKNCDELKAEINKILSKMPVSEVFETLAKAGVPVSPVNHVSDLFDSEQLKARNMIVSLTSPDFEGISTAGNPIKLSAYPDKSETRPPPPFLNGDRDTIIKLFKT